MLYGCFVFNDFYEKKITIHTENKRKFYKYVIKQNKIKTITKIKKCVHCATYVNSIFLRKNKRKNQVVSGVNHFSFMI